MTGKALRKERLSSFQVRLHKAGISGEIGKMGKGKKLGGKVE